MLQPHCSTLRATGSIASACIRSGTVRRLIYTATVMAASPIKDDCSGHKAFMDETCWTPLNLSIPYTNDFLEEYTHGKTLAEKEILSFGNGKMEVVSLVCGLVGGETLMPHTLGSVMAILGMLTNNEFAFNSLKFLEVLLEKVPLVHIKDVTNALIFCMKEPCMKGRFLCGNGCVSIAEMASYFQNKYPEFIIKKEHLECNETETKWGSTLLIERGFEYNFDWHMVLDDSIGCARKNADLGL